MSASHQDDLDELRSNLLAGLEVLAESLLGMPSMRKSRTWRWGSKGSLSLELHGRKRGAWHDHETGQGGGPFHLVQHARSCSMAEAIAWSRTWAGLPEHERKTTVSERTSKPADIEEAADQSRRIEVARSLWERGTLINGSVAARYLIETRAIPVPSTGWPDAVRFHPPTCSLILAATDSTGALHAVQRVHLTPDARKVEGTAERPVKVTNGVLAGAVVRLPGDPNGPLQLAEGPETGLSIWAATQYETWITLGSVTKAEPPVGRTVVIARDDDAAWSPADRKLRELVQVWQAAGIRIAIATPWSERRGDKSDLNDTMQVGGLDAVRARIAEVLAPTIRPGNRKPVLEARRILSAATSRFFDAAAQHDPKSGKPLLVQAIRVDVAVGKSLAARQGAASLVVGIRARGDAGTITFAVPTHALGTEAAAAFEAMPAARAAGLQANIWRGRSALDPDHPGERMCRDLDRVTDAQDAGQSVQTACCKAKTLADVPPIQCPFFDVCGYQAQRHRSADVWFVAHDLLFTERPAAIGEVVAVIVDEAAWPDGLEGVQGRPIMLALDALVADDTVPNDPLAGQRLRFLRELALEALRGAADGPVLREAMQVVGMTPEGAAEARVLEWRRKVDAGMHPAMTMAERKAAARTAEGNRTIRRLAMFWRAVETLLGDGGPAASGWVEKAWSETKEGPVHVLHLKGRKPVREGWQAPTLLLDATLNIDLVRPFWPTVELVADVAAETPHQRIRQVIDRSYSKRHLELHADLDDDERRRRTRHLRELNATLATIGRTYGPGRTLVVAQKAIKEALPTLGMLPPTVELAHHNAVAGLDGWNNVAALVVVGRTAPPPVSVARMAEALTGSAVPLLTGWYSKVASGREMADGSMLAAEVDRHPDPICEAIRWHICEGELVQIIGRARGVNRTEADPVDILVMTDAPLPLALDGTLKASDLVPCPGEMMLAVAGIAYANAAHASVAYPGLWPNRKTAESAFARASGGQMPSNPYSTIPIRECRHLDRIDYQRAGARMSRAMAWFDRTLVLDPAAAVAAVLGPLAWCSLVAAPADPVLDVPPNPKEQLHKSKVEPDERSRWSIPAGLPPPWTAMHAQHPKCATYSAPEGPAWNRLSSTVGP